MTVHRLHPGNDLGRDWCVQAFRPAATIIEANKTARSSTGVMAQTSHPAPTDSLLEEVVARWRLASVDSRLEIEALVLGGGFNFGVEIVPVRSFASEHGLNDDGLVFDLGDLPAALGHEFDEIVLREDGDVATDVALVALEAVGEVADGLDLLGSEDVQELDAAVGQDFAGALAIEDEHVVEPLFCEGASDVGALVDVARFGVQHSDFSSSLIVG